MNDLSSGEELLRALVQAEEQAHQAEAAAAPLIDAVRRAAASGRMVPRTLPVQAQRALAEVQEAARRVRALRAAIASWREA